MGCGGSATFFQVVKDIFFSGA
jgi:hypothetical protein